MLSFDELLALRAYAACRRANLTATRLGAARLSLAAAGLVQDCACRESPMFVAVTGAGREALQAAHPEQAELFPVAGGSR